MARSASVAALGDADYRSLAEIRYLLRNFLAFSEDQAGRHGLTPQQHQALLAIRAAPAPGASIGYVAERLHLKPHSATSLVQRLEALALLSRSRNPGDRRQSLLRLSRQGQRKLGQLSAIHREEIRRLRPLLRQLLAHWDMA